MSGDEVVTRREFDGFSKRMSNSIDSINQSVNMINQAVTKIEVVNTNMDKVVTTMSNVLFGGKDVDEGMVVKMANLTTVQKLQVWVGSLIVAGIIGFAFFMMQHSSTIASGVKQ